eukprot:EG_transcript_67081
MASPAAEAPAPPGPDFDVYDFSAVAPESELCRQQRRIAELEQEVETLRSQATHRERRLEVLTRNISCLYRTAVLELQRRDARIAELGGDAVSCSPKRRRQRS